MMQRRQFLGTLAGAGLATAQRGTRPNIVFVLVDDLRWDALGYAGHPFVKTPNIDRIAREGAIFENAFVTTPLCSPARGSFLTGQYVRSHGVRGNGDNAALSHKMITFPRLLHDAGYVSGYFGKWHMGNDDSPRPGMDRWVSFRGQGQYEDPPLNIDGQQVAAKGYITDLLSDYAAAFIRKQNASKPFCVYLAHKAIHGPFTPAARHANLYADAVIRRSANAQDNLAGKPMLTRELPAVPEKKAAKKKGAPAGPGDELVRNQLRCLTAIDEGLGRVLQALEETKALSNTLIIFTSDNGYFWGEHGLGDKRAAYEESIRIPMAARYPPLIKAGTRINSLVLNIDVAQTALAAAGVAAHKQMQGRSVLPLFAGRTSGWRQHFLCEYFMEQNFARVASWEAVRTARHKYIHYFDLKDMDELYDLQSDPGELKNLIAEPSAKSTLTDMQKLLDSYRKQVRA